MKKALVLVSLLISVKVLAQLVPGGSLSSAVQLGQIGYGGTGCTPASTSVSAEGDLVVALLDGFVVEGKRDALFDRKNCNLRIPLSIAQGYQVIVRGVELQGSYSAGISDVLTLDHGVSIVGAVRVKPTSLKLRGSNSLQTRTSLNSKEWAVSKCGATSAMLAVSMTGLLRQTQTDMNSYLSLESAQLRIEVRRCL
ncbi:DUF4360 domain-containing protein [bacterium]|nr:DUF4360 domain-containing protein [bacterium]